MPVTTTHKDYDKSSNRWQMMRDVIGGEDVIKEAAERYLPVPGGRSVEDFKKYILRAQFFDATSKTSAGMTGGIFRKPPTVKLPTVIDYLAEDADGKGTPLDQLAKDACAEVIDVGRVGLLVDMPAVPIEKRLDQERAMNADARIYVYSAEQIINWAYTRIGSAYSLSRVVLCETIDERSDEDEFAETEVETYRVLDLEIDGGEEVGSGYRVRVFKKDAADGWAEFSVSRPTMPDGQRLDFIPFTFVGSSDNTASVDKPPLLDIASVNIGHYRNSADYEDALFMVGQPTPVIVGLDAQFIEKNKGQFVIGSRAAWMLPTGSSADMLESKRDLAGLSNAIAAKEGQMIQLGAKLIDGTKGGVEAAETIRLRQSGEASVLGSVSENLSRGFTTALAWLSQWMGGTGEDFEFSANSDFFPARLSSADLKELVASWHGGVITYGTLFENLIAGELITAGTDVEDYESELEVEALNKPGLDLDDHDLDDDEIDDDEKDENEDE